MATGATFQNIFFPFVPNSVTGCQLWLDAADSTSLTGTSPVTQWRDKSGNARNTTSYAGTPALTTNAINGVQAINFNGSSSFIGSIPGSGSSYTIFFVGSFNNSTGTYGGLLCFGRSGTPDHVSGITNTKLTDTSMYSTIDSTNSAFTSNTLSTPFLYSLVIDGTNLNSFVNGNQQTPTNIAKSPSFNFTNYVVGDRAGNTSSIFLNGFVGEIIVYINAITISQRQLIEGYLAWKWGLQSNLPSNHPYKNAAPSTNPTINSAQVGTIPLTIQKNRNFVPTQISGCQLWLDGADATTITQSGGTMSQWRDKSSNNNNSTSCSATFSSSINGNTVVTNPTISGPITNSGSSVVNFFIVGTLAATGNLYSSMLSLNAATVTNYYAAGTLFACYYGETNPPRFYSYMNGNLSLSSTGAVNTPFIFNAFQSGTTGTTFFNGNSQGAVGTAGNTFTYTNYHIGAIGGAPAWVGNIAEILVYNNLFTNSQRQQIEGYLAWKWGIVASLPPGHPYLNNNAIFYNPFPSTTPAFTRSISSIFKPTNYAGCQLWLDAWDPFGNGSRQKSPLTLTRWVDKSANARHANMYNGSSISYSPTAFNNRPALLFTQTQNMSSAAAAGTFPTAFTFFMIYQRTGGGTYDALVTRGLANLAAPLDFYTVTSSGNFSRNIGNGTAQSDYNTTSGSNFTNVTTPSLYYANATAASGLLDAFNFATPVDPSSGMLTGVYYADNGTSIYIGTRADSVTTLTASVAEVIVYSTTPTATQRQQIEGYLAWKWGLVASLPASHPYKNYPPPPQ
jgi:hypothetical protein